MLNLTKSSSNISKYRILFDMDGTLLDLAFDNYIWMQQVPEIWAQQNQSTIEYTKQHLYQFYLENQGKLHWYSSKFWQNHLNIDVLALQSLHRKRIQARPYCFDLLEQLKNHNIECWLVTNADLATLELKLENVNLRPYFKHIISSESIGYPKEELNFWETLQQQHGFDPQHTYFIDDNYDVLKSAQQYGIRHLYSITQPDSSVLRENIDQTFVHLNQLTELLTSHPQYKEQYGT